MSYAVVASAVLALLNIISECNANIFSYPRSPTCSKIVDNISASGLLFVCCVAERLRSVSRTLLSIPPLVNGVKMLQSHDAHDTVIRCYDATMIVIGPFYSTSLSGSYHHDAHRAQGCFQICFPGLYKKFSVRCSQK